MLYQELNKRIVKIDKMLIQYPIHDHYLQYTKLYVQVKQFPQTSLSLFINKFTMFTGPKFITIFCQNLAIISIKKETYDQ